MLKVGAEGQARRRDSGSTGSNMAAVGARDPPLPFSVSTSTGLHCPLLRRPLSPPLTRLLLLLLPSSERHQKARLQGLPCAAAGSCRHRWVFLSKSLGSFPDRPPLGVWEFASRGAGAWQWLLPMARPERRLRAPDRLDGYTTQVSPKRDG